MNERSASQASDDFVQIAIPARYVMRVYSFLAALERGGASEGTEPDDTMVRPDLDAELAARMFIESEARHRSLLLLLAENPGKWLYTSDLANGLGITTGSKSMAGMFGAFGRRAKHRYQGLKPWNIDWDETRNEARYIMEPQTSKWILDAAEKEGPPWS